MEDLERVKGVEEQVPKSSEQEVKEPTLTEPKPTSETGAPTPTFTQENLDQAVADAVADAVAKGEQKARSIQSTSDKKIAELEKQKGEAELAGVEKAELARWTEAGLDENETKAFQEGRRQLKKAEQDFQAQKTSYEGYFAKVQEIEKGQKAKSLASEYGVDEKELLKAQSPEEMDTIAGKLSYEKLKAELEQLRKTPEKIDSSLPSATGSGSFKQLEQNYADGQISTAEYEKALKEQGKI